MPKWSQLDNKADLQKTRNYNSLGRYRNYSKVIIICIDRDDDIGIKGGMETPIIGKESCVNAGTRLAIEDPEDSDSNAIFGAVKSYEEFKMKGYDVEIALVAGKFNRGIDGDVKIAQEIDKVLEVYAADGYRL